MFKLNNDADIGGTSLQGYIEFAPIQLKEKFGSPTEGDEYKVSGEYVFEGPNGEIFTLYDWKHTSLYNSGDVNPEEFWSSHELYNFHIGCDSKFESVLTKFKSWLIETI